MHTKTMNWIDQTLANRGTVPDASTRRAVREWLRNGTNVRLTADLPYEALLLHQRINRRTQVVNRPFGGKVYHWA